MKPFFLTLLLFSSYLLVYSQDESQNQDPPTAEELQAYREQFDQNLQFQKGQITLKGGIATLDVPEHLRFLGPEDAKTLLVDGWGNPPSIAEGTLGMLVPVGIPTLASESWGVAISFEAEGYVKDDDAKKLDYEDILQSMQDSMKESNKRRKEAGYETVQLVGWAEAPHYDGDNHKLYWAKELKFGDAEINTLNYDIRILGRKGYLVLQAISEMPQLAAIKPAMEEIVTFTNFEEGHRYADFNPELDKVAAYGIGGLIAGKVAMKAGFFKGLIALLVASKKLVIIAIIAIGAFLAKIFGKKKGSEEQLT